MNCLNLKSNKGGSYIGLYIFKIANVMTKEMCWTTAGKNKTKQKIIYGELLLQYNLQRNNSINLKPQTRLHPKNWNLDCLLYRDFWILDQLIQGWMNWGHSHLLMDDRPSALWLLSDKCKTNQFHSNVTEINEIHSFF